MKRKVYNLRFRVNDFFVIYENVEFEAMSRKRTKNTTFIG